MWMPAVNAPKPGERERGEWALGTELHFFVAGHEPVAKGNLRAFTPKGWSRPVITDRKGKEVRAYQNAVSDAARAELDKRGLPCAFRQPFVVTFGFYVARPDSHFDRHGRVKPSAPAYPITKPDFDKVTRAACDALTSVVWDDDSRVTRAVIEQNYADAITPVGTFVKVAVRPATVGQLLAFKQKELLK